LPVGFQAAQIVHAAGESVSGELPPNTNAVVLAAKDETELRAVARKLQLAGVPHVLIQEVDPPFDGQCTAIGVVPLAERAKVKPILSKLPLLGARPKDAGSEPAPTNVPVRVGEARE
jgi:hypothetical protein